MTLLGQGKFEVTQTKYRLTEEQKQEDGQLLWAQTASFARELTLNRLDFCAECLDSFIRDSLGRTEADGKLPLGFTVSDSTFGFYHADAPHSSHILARKLTHLH